MTGRDRTVVIVLAVLVLLAGGWMLIVSPKRKEAKTVEAKVTNAQSEVSTAEGQLANARAAQAQYSTSYSAVVNLGKAVPPSEEVASLLYQLEEASNLRHVSFNSIVSGASGSGSTSSASTTTTAAASSGFSQLPFTFIFTGGFFSLERLFRQLTSFTTHQGPNGLRVSGRLLTIQGVKLSPEGGAPGHSNQLTGTVTATAYVLPAGQTVANGATAAAPASAAAPSGSSSSPTAPAVAKVTP